MSFSLTASGHIPSAAADGTAQDATQVELELYEALKAVLGDPKYGCASSSFSGSHVSGSMHLADTPDS